MKFNKSFLFIETVTFVTLLRISFSIPLTQNNLKRASQQRRLENSITLNDINYHNSEYRSYGNELYEAYPIQANYKEKESKYSTGSKYPVNNERYPNTERQTQEEEEKEEKVTTYSEGNNNSDQGRMATMEWNTTVVLVTVVLIIIVLVAIGCGIFMICKKDNPETGPGYSVAVSNRLFKEGGMDGKDLPCLNCRLIEMGEMACYTERCPQCNNVPPCRKELYPELPSNRELEVRARFIKMQQTHVNIKK
jgi:hypothetical protein